MPRIGSGGGEPSTTLDTMVFPNEISILDSVSGAIAEDKRQTEQLNIAAETAVEEWLKEQGIDPDNPPAHWLDCP